MPGSLSSVAATMRRLGCTPAEAVALAVLVAGAVAALGLLWALAGPGPGGSVEPLGLGPTELLASEDGPLGVAPAEVVVHVAGAVRQPGLYTLPGGSRVGDAITAAGGPKPKAVLDALNLAAVLTDGEQLLVPDRRALAAPQGTGATAPPAPGSAAAGAAGADLVSLNQATATDLETLPGIGPVLAERIIQHRDSVGGFKEVGELRDVPGIGEKTFQALAELVSL